MLTSAIDWSAFLLSLKLAFSSTLILVVVGLPFCYWLAFDHRRWVILLEALFSLPMVLPPTVLGFYLLLALGPLRLAFTFTGLLIASLLSSVPFAFQAFLTAFRGVDRGFYETSWMLGESPLRTLLRVGLPLAKSGLFSGAILAFAHTLGEFGVVLMIGGNIPGVSRTLSIALYDQVEAFDSRAATQTALLLLVFSVLAMISVSLLRGKRRTE